MAATDLEAAIALRPDRLSVQRLGRGLLGGDHSPSRVIRPEPTVLPRNLSTPKRPVPFRVMFSVSRQAELLQQPVH
jgi:hypothetical protein